MRVRTYLPLGLIGLACYFLFLVRSVTFPFILASAISYLLNPLVLFLEIRGFRRRVAALLVFVISLLIVVLAAFLGVQELSRQAAQMVTEMPLHLRHFQTPSIAWLHSHPELWNWVREISNVNLSQIMEQGPALFRHVIPMMELIFLVPLLTYFFMADGPAFLNWLIQLVPGRQVETTLHVVVEIDSALGRYVRGLCVQSLFIGFFAGLGFWLIGLHSAVQVGLWVALTSLVPYVGPISAALVGGIAAFLQWGTFLSVMKVIGICATIRFIDDWFLQPLILRRAVHLHPMLTIFILMVGGTLGGIWGLLFAVPVACMIKVLLGVLWEWLRSENHRLSPLEIEASRIPLV